MPLPAAWRTAEDPASAEWPASDWWRGFKSPALEALIAGAEHANDDLAAAIARVDEAMGDEREERFRVRARECQRVEARPFRDHDLGLAGEHARDDPVRGHIHRNAGRL